MRGSAFRTTAAKSNRALISRLLGVAALACSLAPATEADPQPLLHELFHEHFLIGVSVEREELPESSNPEAHSGLLAHFDAFTPENEMKWEHLQPVEGTFDFAAADALVAYAEAQQASVAGHTLVWHRQTPEWVFKAPDGGPASRELVLSRLRTHIQTVMQHYRGRIYGWDVVNEALSDAPKEYLRDSPWLRTIGEDYIALAFQFAREADPDAKLYYNDYAIEYPHKREKMVRLVKELEAAGVLPDAVNIQGHFSLEMPPAAEIGHTLQAIADLGLRANISELDVSLFNFLDRSNPYPESAPPRLLERQAQRYGELFALFLRYDSAIDRVTFWNLHDGRSWLNNEPVPGRTDYPLLFDRAGQPKPAFYSVVDALKD